MSADNKKRKSTASGDDSKEDAAHDARDERIAAALKVLIEEDLVSAVAEDLYSECVDRRLQRCMRLIGSHPDCDVDNPLDPSWEWLEEETFLAMESTTEPTFFNVREKEWPQRKQFLAKLCERKWWKTVEAYKNTSDDKEEARVAKFLGGIAGVPAFLSNEV